MSTFEFFVMHGKLALFEIEIKIPRVSYMRRQIILDKLIYQTDTRQYSDLQLQLPTILTNNRKLDIVCKDGQRIYDWLFRKYEQ